MRSLRRAAASAVLLSLRVLEALHPRAVEWEQAKTSCERRRQVLQPGTELHRGYTIESVLGKGGMGAVYLARQKLLGGRKVAIKETILQLVDPRQVAEARAQFQKEAQILASLEHPGLVDVKDYFEENGAQYLVMSFIDGETLEEIVRRADGLLPLRQVLDWADHICDVLMYLHEHEPPVVVRDLKPSNVMVDRSGRLFLIDFGIARIFEPQQQTSLMIKGSGTVGFAPPEQFAGARTDARFDVYALGATLYYLLTRRIPPWSAALASGQERLDAPSVVNPAIPTAVEGAVGRMMALSPQARFQSIAEARAALREAASTLPAAAPERRFCTSCGTTMVPGTSACPRCGTSQTATPPSGPWGASQGSGGGQWSASQGAASGQWGAPGSPSQGAASGQWGAPGSPSQGAASGQWGAPGSPSQGGGPWGTPSSPLQGAASPQWGPPSGGSQGPPSGEWGAPSGPQGAPSGPQGTPSGSWGAPPQGTPGGSWGAPGAWSGPGGSGGWPAPPASGAQAAPRGRSPVQMLLLAVAVVAVLFVGWSLLSPKPSPTPTPTATTTGAPTTTSPSPAASPSPTDEADRIRAGRFSIVPASGWTSMTKNFPKGIPSEIFLVLMAPSNDGDFRPNVNVLSQKNVNLDLDAYTNANKRGMAVSSDTTITVNGRPARRLIWTNRKLGYMTVIFMVDHTSYLITCTSPRDTFSSHEAEFDRMTQSVRIDD